MNRFVAFVMFFLTSFGFAQDYLPVNAQLPLVTVGVENAGSWTPEGDLFILDLPEASDIKLWIDSRGVCALYSSVFTRSISQPRASCVYQYCIRFRGRVW